MVFSSFCRNQLNFRACTMILPGFKDVNFLQNRTLISSAIRHISGNAAKRHSFTVSCLVNSCGFSPESALSISRKVQFKSRKAPDSVINFFKKHDFSQTQIRKLIEKRPRLLSNNPEKNLLPKFQFFYSKGISSSDLARALSSNPHVLERSLDSRIIPSFNFFKDLTHCDDNKVLLAYSRFHGVLEKYFQSAIAPNLALLRKCGVPESNIVSKLVDHPRVFAASREKFKRTVEEAKKLGFNPLKHDFLHALQALIQMSKSTYERKFNVFREWGWSDEEIVSAFVKFPYCMINSEHKIKSTMNFYVKTMGWKSSYIANSPCLLSYSLEKRIIPRCSVIQVLLSKGLIKKEPGASTLLCVTEKKFLQRFVTPYEDPHLLKLYEEKLRLFK